MTDEKRLAEIAKRLAEATPGPWQVIFSGDEKTRTRYEWSIWDEAGNAFVLSMERKQQIPSLEWAKKRSVDFDFIAHAPSDIAYLLESLRASQQGGIPEGWKLVPVEATDNMIDAGWASSGEENARNTWRDMIAASPPLPLSDGRNAIIEECAKVAVATADCVRIGDGEYGGGKLNAARNIAIAIRALKSTKPGADGDMA